MIIHIINYIQISPSRPDVSIHITTNSLLIQKNISHNCIKADSQNMHTCIKYSKDVTKSAPYTRSSDAIVGFRGRKRSGIIVNITIKSETQTQDPCIILGRLWRNRI